MTEGGKAPTVSIDSHALRFQGRPMPMSEEERRLLKELELGLIADDPHLAMELLSGYPSRRFRSGTYNGSAAGLLGLALLIIGISVSSIGVGISGLLLIALGLFLALRRRTPNSQGRHGQAG